eukprot:443160_1
MAMYNEEISDGNVPFPWAYVSVGAIACCFGVIIIYMCSRQSKQGRLLRETQAALKRLGDLEQNAVEMSSTQSKERNSTQKEAEMETGNDELRETNEGERDQGENSLQEDEKCDIEDCESETESHESMYDANDTITPNGGGDDMMNVTGTATAGEDNADSNEKRTDDGANV